MGPHMPRMEEFLNQISTGITGIQKKPLWNSDIHLEYAYGEPKLLEEISKHCIFGQTGGTMNGYYRFKKYYTVYPSSRQSSKMKTTKHLCG